MIAIETKDGGRIALDGGTKAYVLAVRDPRKGFASLILTPHELAAIGAVIDREMVDRVMRDPE